MRSLSHAGHFDWDGLQTLILTCLLLIASFGLLLLPSLAYTYRTARETPARSFAGGVYLVFGKRSPDGQVDDEYKQRLEKAAELYHAQPRPLILVGGYTTLGKPSEAAAGLTELRRIGVPDNAKVYLEEASRHTLENLRNARELCATQQILISNRYHLARCSLIATSLGISHVLCAAEAELENSFSTHLKLIKESFFILWFRIGHGWAWLTNNRRMLDRIS